MDSDQEVVREPFEDQESIRSNEQSPDGSNRRCSHDNGAVKDLHNVHSRVSAEKPNEIKVDNDIDDEDDDTSLNSDNIEDVKFAKSFGIKLKGPKNEQAYEQLMNSGHFVCQKEEEGQGKTKTKPPIATSVTSDCIYHKGTFYQKGDIVALCDQEDGQLYFAQLTGFLQDQYCEKSASVNWLVPTRSTSRDFFDPSAYRLGLEDLQLRKLDCMTFVRHCPHDYYLRKYFEVDKTNPPPEQPINISSRSNKDQNYVWTTMEPCHVPICRYN